MNQLTSYSAANVAINIDNVLASGLWEGDDAVVFEPNADITNFIVGMQGDVIASITQNRAGLMTLRLQHTSETHQFLERKYNQMVAGRLPFFKTSLTDTGTGEGGSADQCLILRRPNTQYGTNASVREWVILCANWVNNEVTYE